MLKMEHVAVNIGDRIVLRDVNLHIKPGEVHVLFGPNGSGKSTLLGAIMGFNRYKITAGKIWFKGQDITDMPVDARSRLGIGIMIQRPPTVRGVSLRQLAAICARGDISVNIEELAKAVNMDAFLDRSANEGFSGGEIKRSELLQLMAQNPDFVMLDEPESGVDLENIALVGEAANRILERKNLSTAQQRRERIKAGLIITHTGHILDYVPADIGHVLYGGTISCNGNPQEMLDCISKYGYQHCIRCSTEGGGSQ
ncbi:MAG: sufC [Firmicutes bacterium]|nr:sufC [Bacillota bacterium]